jgi:hypothetical protein
VNPDGVRQVTWSNASRHEPTAGESSIIRNPMKHRIMFRASNGRQKTTQVRSQMYRSRLAELDPLIRGLSRDSREAVPNMTPQEQARFDWEMEHGSFTLDELRMKLAPLIRGSSRESGGEQVARTTPTQEQALFDWDKRAGSFSWDDVRLRTEVPYTREKMAQHLLQRLRRTPMYMRTREERDLAEATLDAGEKLGLFPPLVVVGIRKLAKHLGPRRL